MPTDDTTTTNPDRPNILLITSDQQRGDDCDRHQEGRTGEPPDTGDPWTPGHCGGKYPADGLVRSCRLGDGRRGRVLWIDHRCAHHRG